MTEIICLLLWIVCIGLMYWSDVSAQQHIEKGFDKHD